MWSWTQSPVHQFWGFFVWDGFWLRNEFFFLWIRKRQKSIDTKLIENWFCNKRLRFSFLIVQATYVSSDLDMPLSRLVLSFGHQNNNSDNITAKFDGRPTGRNTLASCLEVIGKNVGEMRPLIHARAHFKKFLCLQESLRWKQRVGQSLSVMKLKKRSKIFVFLSTGRQGDLRKRPWFFEIRKRERLSQMKPYWQIWQNSRRRNGRRRSKKGSFRVIIVAISKKIVRKESRFRN